MKPRRTSRPPAAHELGILLFECIVYIGVLTILLAIGTAAFWYCWDSNKALHRNADAIVHALRAGERWRADVRAATGLIQVETAEGTERCRIPTAQGEVVYRVTAGELRRQGPGINGILLTQIDSSRMQLDRRQHIVACRWEVELRRTRKDATIRPLFVFEAVPATAMPQ